MTKKMNIALSVIAYIAIGIAGALIGSTVERETNRTAVRDTVYVVPDSILLSESSTFEIGLCAIRKEKKEG